MSGEARRTTSCVGRALVCTPTFLEVHRALAWIVCTPCHSVLYSLCEYCSFDFAGFRSRKLRRLTYLTSILTSRSPGRMP